MYILNDRDPDGDVSGLLAVSVPELPADRPTKFVIHGAAPSSSASSRAGYGGLGGGEQTHRDDYAKRTSARWPAIGTCEPFAGEQLTRIAQGSGRAAETWSRRIVGSA